MTSPISRRTFQTQLAAGLGAAVGTSAVAAAEETPGLPPSEAVELPVEVLYEQLLQRMYPDVTFDEAAWTEIRTDIAGIVRRSAALSTFPLKNSDEPAGVFSAAPVPESSTGS